MTAKKGGDPPIVKHLTNLPVPRRDELFGEHRKAVEETVWTFRNLSAEKRSAMLAEVLEEIDNDQARFLANRENGARIARKRAADFAIAMVLGATQAEVKRRTGITAMAVSLAVGTAEPLKAKRAAIRATRNQPTSEAP